MKWFVLTLEDVAEKSFSLLPPQSILSWKELEWWFMKEFYGLIEDNTSVASPSIGSPYQNQIQLDYYYGNAICNIRRKEGESIEKLIGRIMVIYFQMLDNIQLNSAILEELIVRECGPNSLESTCSIFKELNKKVHVMYEKSNIKTRDEHEDDCTKELLVPFEGPSDEEAMDDIFYYDSELEEIITNGDDTKLSPCEEIYLSDREQMVDSSILEKP